MIVQDDIHLYFLLVLCIFLSIPQEKKTRKQHNTITQQQPNKMKGENIKKRGGKKIKKRKELKKEKKTAQHKTKLLHI